MPAPYERPLLPWLAAWGTFVVAAGLVVVLALFLARSGRRRTGRPGRRPAKREDVERAARELRSRSAGFGERFPPELERFAKEYLGEPRVFVCPTVADHFKAEYWPEGGEVLGVEWCYCLVSGLTQLDPHGYVVAFDEEWNHDSVGVNVLYLGGHVEWTTDPAEVRDALARQSAKLKSREREMPVIRPWWSRHPEPPSFFIPEPPDAPKTGWVAIVAVSAGAVALAGCVVAFAVFAYRRWARASSPSD